MPISAPDAGTVRATDVRVSDDTLTVDLDDGRTLAVPLTWYPRLGHATAKERANWRLIGGGEGIHWPDIEEDLSIHGLIEGRPSQEAQSSFSRWLESRKAPTQKNG